MSTKVIITGLSYTACRRLLEALEENGIRAAVCDAGRHPEYGEGVELRQVVLAPPELPFGFPLPKSEYVHVNSEREVSAQVAAVIEELGWKSAS